MMLGVELVTDRKLKTPAKAEILHVMEQMKGIRNIMPSVLTFWFFKLDPRKLINLDVNNSRYGSIGWKRRILWKCFQNYTSTLFQ